MEDLQALILRAKAGDLTAYGTIVQRFQDMAVGYAYSILGDFQLAEDAAQEAFIEAYSNLAKLRLPSAFPGWFRKVIFKHCDRLKRDKSVTVVSLEDSSEIISGEPRPDEVVETLEIKDRVLQALQTLPEHERIVTALFYIDGYSQNEISEFLEVPVTTVKKRLYDSRKRLRERMIGMVSETLKGHSPDERFSGKVIEELLHRPKPMDIEGHPVRGIWDQIRAALWDYEVTAGEEVVDKTLYEAVQKDVGVSVVYHVSDRKILRPDTTHTIFQAIRGRTPPVRLLAAGRVFRADQEDERHSKVFHQVDGLCIDQGANIQTLKTTCERAITAVFGDVEVRWRDYDYKFVDASMEIDIKLNDKWFEVGGCGLLKPEMLLQAGYDAEVVSGFAFGLGLERLAMIKLGIDDIRRLWRSPYVPER